jgi:hypothetical protein
LGKEGVKMAGAASQVDEPWRSHALGTVPGPRLPLPADKRLPLSPGAQRVRSNCRMARGGHTSRAASSVFVFRTEGGACQRRRAASSHL